MAASKCYGGKSYSLYDRNRIDNITLCPDCQKKKFTQADDATAAECGCAVTEADLLLCIRHAILHKRCRACGTDLGVFEEMARRKALRDQRRRQLRECIKKRAPFKEEECEQQQRKNKNSGRTKKTRQRHRKKK